MFDVGFWELIILFGLGLVILGPERLPKVAMQVGNWAGQARRMARQLSGQIRRRDSTISISLTRSISKTRSRRPTPNQPYEHRNTAVPVSMTSSRPHRP